MGLSTKEIPVIKMSTIEMAIAAWEQTDRALEDRLFGHFEARTLDGTMAELALEAGRYAYVGSPLHLQVWVRGALSCWEPYLTLTRNVRPNDCKADEILVKTHEENAHLRQSLLNTGLFADTGKRLPCGYVELEVWRLTMAFCDAFKDVHALEPA